MSDTRAPALRTPVFSRSRWSRKTFDARFLHELAEHRLGHVGLEVPFDGTLVLAANALEELQRVAADDFLPAIVGPPEPSGHHAAEVLTRFEERDLESFARGRDGGDRPAGRAAVDDDVERLRRRGIGWRDWAGLAAAGFLRGGAGNGSVSGRTRTPVVNLNGYLPPLGNVSSTKNAVQPFGGRVHAADPGVRAGWRQRRARVGGRSRRAGSCARRDWSPATASRRRAAPSRRP